LIIAELYPHLLFAATAIADIYVVPLLHEAEKQEALNLDSLD